MFLLIQSGPRGITGMNAWQAHQLLWAYLKGDSVVNCSITPDRYECWCMLQRLKGWSDPCHYGGQKSAQVSSVLQQNRVRMSLMTAVWWYGLINNSRQRLEIMQRKNQVQAALHT